MIKNDKFNMPLAKASRTRYS